MMRIGLSVTAATALLLMVVSTSNAGLGRRVALRTSRGKQAGSPYVLGTAEEQRAVYAINDTGEAVVAYPVRDYPSQIGHPEVIVARIADDGRMIDPQVVRLPPGAGSAEGGGAAEPPLSLALSDSGQVALGDANKDFGGTRAGVATWMLGATPPVVQELSPPEGEWRVDNTPQVAIDNHGRVFAAWTANNQTKEIVQAATAERSGYSVDTLYTTESGARLGRDFDLQQDGEGRPVVNWTLGEAQRHPGYVFATSTAEDGWGPSYRGVVPSFDETPFFSLTAGIVTDSAGNQTLLNEPKERQLWMLSRAAGSAFGHPRRIATNIEEATIASGGQTTTLVAWTTHRHDYVTAEVGKVPGKPGTPQRFRTISPGGLSAWVDDLGHVALMWGAAHRASAHSRAVPGLWLTTAGTNGRFRQLRFIPNPARNCGSGPVATSPNGHALIIWTCGAEEHETMYIARYTP